MNMLSYKPLAHTESMQDIKLQAENVYEKNNVPVLPALPYRSANLRDSHRLAGKYVL